MSMLCTLWRISPAQIDMIRADPTLLEQLLHGQIPSTPSSSTSDNLLNRIFGTKKVVRTTHRSIEAVTATDKFDLDQQWHILHFLLTGQAEEGPFPAAFLCTHGEEIGTDLGYGSPRLFTITHAEQISAYLSSLDKTTFTARYQVNAFELHELYWRAPDSVKEQQEELEWLWETLMELRDFLNATANQNKGFVIEIY